MANTLIHDDNSCAVDESLSRGRAILEDAEKYLSFFEDCFSVTSPFDDESKKNDASPNCRNSSNLEYPMESSGVNAQELACTNKDLIRNKNCITSTLEADEDISNTIDTSMGTGTCVKKSLKLSPEKNDEWKLCQESDEEVRNAIAYLRDIRVGACKSFFNNENTKEKMFDLVREGELLKNTAQNNKGFSRHRKFCYYEEESNGVNNMETRRKVVKTFDPNTELEVLKRASKRAAKRAEVEAACKAEAREKSKFKALPLPSGVPVANNPYALTKSALNRQQKIGDKAVDEKDLKLRECPNPNIRKMSKRSHDVMKEIFFKCSFEEPYLELSRPVKLYLNNEFMAETINVIEYLKSMGKFNSCSLADLHQKNGKLHAILTEKRRQCKDLQHLIRHEVSLIKILKSYSLFDHDKISVFQETGIDMEEIDVDMTPDEYVEEKSDGKKIEDIHRRHEKWRLDKQAKIDHARQQQIRDSMVHVTGRPQITHSKKSWEVAKFKHDHVLSSENNFDSTVVNQIVDETEEEKQRFLLMKKKENEERKRNCSVKRTIKKQKGALDKLAQPRMNCSVEKLKSTAKNSSKPQREDGIQNKQKERQQVAYAEVEKTSKKDVPKFDFDDMDDKQFSNILKSMGLGATSIKRKSKSNNNNCKNPLSIETNHDNTVISSENHETKMNISKSEKKTTVKGAKRSKAKSSNKKIKEEKRSLSAKSAEADDKTTRMKKNSSCEAKKLEEVIDIYNIDNRPNGLTAKARKSNDGNEIKEPKKLPENDFSCATGNETNNNTSVSSSSVTSVMRDTIQRYNNSMKKIRTI